MTFVPSFTLDSMVSLSQFFCIFGRPIPAPNPISRTSGEAVEYPSCMARSMSGIPGPRSLMTTVMTVGSIDTCMVPS